MKLSRYLSFLILFFLSWSNQINSQVTISGVISDATSGESLIGATVLAEAEAGEAPIGTVTNEYGFYSLPVTEGEELKITYSYVGYQPMTIETTGSDTTLNIDLIPGNQVLEEVIVKANSFREELRSTQMSTEAITTREAKLLPALLGEVDVLKTLQLKPGISSGSEGSSGLFVRGGSSDQNLIILDDAIVYNANHLFGFFSTFNPDAVKDLRAFKGGFPARYGGRLSSVIDVRLKEGNNRKFSGRGGIGLIASRLTLEGPIVEKEASFIVSGRRTYVDLFTETINKRNADDPDYSPIPAYSFFDLNAKVNYKLSDQDHLYLSGYFGRDVFNFTNEDFDFNFNWGNGTGTARWNHTFNDRIFSNTTFTYSDYQYNLSNKLPGFSISLGSAIRDISLKSDLFFNPSTTHNIRGGLSITHHTFDVGRLRGGSDDGEITFSSGDEYQGTEYGAYISDKVRFSSNFQLEAGLRLSGFWNDSIHYSGLEPRIALNYRLSNALSLKGSYARMNQYIHLISNSAIALPTDIWYPSTGRVKPQRSDQVAAGLSWLPDDRYMVTVEGYYKWLDQQIDFVDNANLFVNDNLEGEFTFGDGYGYGFEFGVEKKEGDFRGWIGYTLAWIWRGNFPDIMDGRYFRPRYDRRHDLSVVSLYQINRKYSLTGTFVYGSGDVGWLPSGRFFFQDVPGKELTPVIPIYGDRNSFRLPPYHRLDLGFVIRFFPDWGETDLTFSIYNVYSRRNPYFIVLDVETSTINAGGVDIEVPDKIEAQQISLFPIIPSVTWNFQF